MVGSAREVVPIHLTGSVRPHIILQAKLIKPAIGDKALTPRPLGYIRRRLAPEFASHQIVQELAPVDTRGIECIFYGLLGYAALTQLHANPRRSIQTLGAAVHIRFGKTHIALQPLVAQTGQLRRDMRGTTETP